MIRRIHVLLLTCIRALVGCCNSDPPAKDPQIEQPVASAPTARPSRCQPIGQDYWVGSRSPSSDDLDKILPFATELGDGVAFDGGFAVGALSQQGQGTAFEIITTNRDGTAWRKISAGASHGDADAPRVFSRGKTLGMAILEPSGSSRTLRLARIDRDQILWASEILQDQDESLAYDVVIGKEVAVAVWDGVPKGRDVGAVFLATFDPTTFQKPSKPKVMTLPGTDAEMPRLLERSGGFWLFWLARRPGSPSDDSQYRAEDIDYRWIEALPLDNRGAMTGTAVRLGPTDGHVLGFDVVSLQDDSAMVVWRDDDTPSGSPGGQLFMSRVRLGGVEGPERIDEEHTGVGAPNVMPGWFAIADALGSTRLAPLSPDGKLTDKLLRESLLGSGEPIANHGNDLFVSRPEGTAMRLFVARCLSTAIDGGSQDEEESRDAEP
ncbi:MAG TPA: hypothetical protein PLJ27_10695 [Polyangiaceae bacterium]|jgi:hypothetical protein|nr:MAG: hypothetical protein BWY17_02038 [Deltaproteobacteria bacterium ADurb.Bin207]HNS99124.1 hypothetical protein [Polyangiaceae bacterium]HNZ24197.1 hypothetical protein [Polyangiaceae bacterium]HOD22554.1 hypothetical protein [Polyangiaceae bacterium]HOE49450.1 hypothetical protein [Polyangiaceae bacterium]